MEDLVSDVGYSEDSVCGATCIEEILPVVQYVKRIIQKPLIKKRHQLYEERIARQAVPYEVWLKDLLEQEKAELQGWKKGFLEQGKAELQGWKKGFLEQGKADQQKWKEDQGKAESSDQEGQEGESTKKIPAVEVVPYRKLYDFLSDAGREKADIALFVSDPDCLTERAEWEIKRYFLEHPEVSIAYGNEDGWFKPDWSPDTLQSFFYFGNVFAVRKTLLQSVLMQTGSEALRVSRKENRENLRKSLYEMVLCCIDQAKTAGHIEKVLYVLKKNDNGIMPKTGNKAALKTESGMLTEMDADWGWEEAFDEMKKGHCYSDIKIPEIKKASDQEKQELVSIIIPSKDNPAMLSKCIHSLREQTEYQNIEIIVIDNGSNDINRERIRRIQVQMKEEYSFRYYYCPMEFNFSVMCNIGAKKARGSYLLFLNDDMEIVRGDWLHCMMKRALKEYVGAVGAKLLYPDGNRIQHLGITSIHLGPAHKLQFSSDKQTYYHRINRCAVNVSAVTGACLLVRKEIFEKAGGFSEELQVSYNDVELCFHIMKMGYHNVCCNDTFLYHHESFSRGADYGLKKIKRLHQERDFLYGRYPEMWNSDPYYAKELVRDILDRGFAAACRFEEKRVSQKAVPERINGELAPAWHNECLHLELEFTGDRQAWETGRAGSGDYYIQGYSYAVNVDNSRYKKSLLLKKFPEGKNFRKNFSEPYGKEHVSGARRFAAEEMWKVPYEECYRADIEENLPQVDHPGLSGISVWLRRDALPAGEYLIGVLWEDACSRQKLYRFSSEILKVTGTEEQD